jgi:hypothetical protein
MYPSQVQPRHGHGVVHEGALTVNFRASISLADGEVMQEDSKGFLAILR